MKHLTKNQLKNIKLLCTDFKIQPLDYALLAGFIFCCIGIVYIAYGGS